MTNLPAIPDPPPTPPQPWERQKGESAKAFEAFCTYRDMGTNRSLAKAAGRVGKSPALLEDWSSKWGWVERCAEWENELDRRFRETSFAEQLEANRRLVAAGNAFMGRGLRRMRDPTDTNPDAGLADREIDAQAAARLFEVGMKAVRLGMGDPTEVIGGLGVRPQDVKSIIDAIVEVSLRYIDEAQHASFISEGEETLRRVITGRRTTMAG